jgi:RNAse (barnase) inhibitor barstar
MTILDRPAPPWLVSLEGSPDEAYELAWRRADNATAVRVLRGHKMRTAQALFDEVGAALQFPDYFGENWPALDECLTDLAWMPAHRYVLVVVRSLDVLMNEKRDMLHLFGDVLADAAEEWARPVRRGESWDRPAIPFHVILQIQRGERDFLMELWGRPIAEFAE